MNNHIAQEIQEKIKALTKNNSQKEDSERLLILMLTHSLLSDQGDDP